MQKYVVLVTWVCVCVDGGGRADFQQVPLVQLFWYFHNIVVKYQLFIFTKEK